MQTSYITSIGGSRSTFSMLPMERVLRPIPVICDNSSCVMPSQEIIVKRTWVLPAPMLLSLGEQG